MAKLNVNALRGRLTSPRNHRVFKQTLERRYPTEVRLWRETRRVDPLRVCRHILAIFSGYSKLRSRKKYKV
jgi:hypothetical protein